MADSQLGALPSVLPSPCGGCGYDLTGIAGPERGTCPECGLNQPMPATSLEWPRWPSMAIRTCAATLVLCNVCFVLVLINDLVPPVLAIFAALVTLLSGPVAPVVIFIAMSRCREYDDGAKFILLGWLWNLLIGAAYVGLASVWPYQWTLHDETAFW